MNNATELQLYTAEVKNDTIEVSYALCDDIDGIEANANVTNQQLKISAVCDWLDERDGEQPGYLTLMYLVDNLWFVVTDYLKFEFEFEFELV